MKSYLHLLIVGTLLLYQPAVFAQQVTLASATPTPIEGTATQYVSSPMTATQYQQLPASQQQALADIWHLSVTDYSHYLWLMQNTPNGVYYQNMRLDPTWILGFNAKDDDERKKYAAIAIQNERERVAKELAFQNTFYQLQKQLYPNDKPIATTALIKLVKQNG